MRAKAMWLAAGVLGAGVALAAPVAAGTISIDDGTGASSFNSQLAALIDRYKTESAAYRSRVDASGEAFEQYYNPVQERNLIFGREGSPLSDVEWARANLRIYDIYEQIGGNEIGLRQLYKYKNGRYFVALDGVGGQWFDSPAQAHGYLLKLLVDTSIELPADVKDAVAALAGNGLDSVLNTARGTLASNRAFLSRGRSTTATLTGAYNSSLGAPVVQGPPGVYVDTASVAGDGTVTVALRTTGEAALGPAELLMFNNGRSITPTDRFSIFVVDGAGAAEPPADDHGGSITSASAIDAGADVDGHLEKASDTDVYAVTVTQGGTLVVTSSGGSDVVGAILNASGAVLASNDDGGSWYNFRVAQDVAPGTYYVRVRHCCGGTGSYQINAAFSPSS
ncbi:MAG: PPC domain-containing protein [Alphaproteobacteria bacterium]